MQLVTGSVMKSACLRVLQVLEEAATQECLENWKTSMREYFEGSQRCLFPFSGFLDTIIDKSYCIVTDVNEFVNFSLHHNCKVDLQLVFLL